MTLLKRVVKLPIISNRATVNYIVKQIKAGKTLLDIHKGLNSKHIKHTWLDLTNTFQELAKGNGFVAQLNRFRPSERIPNYFFRPMRGRALTPYRVSVTLAMRNDTLDTTFARTIDLNFRERPTRLGILDQLQQVKELLKDQSDITVTDVGINFFATSLE